MQFSRKTVNKLVSYVDRYYTWDTRSIKREGDIVHQDYIALNEEHNTSVCVSRGKYGIWASIRKDGRFIVGDYLKTYKEITNFKKMVRCLG